ncbi:MAG: MEDS domain-containing protein, partial [Planctomycetota bacterium]
MHIQTSDQASLDLGFGGYTCNWGLHMCGLYETEEERDEIILGFLHAGDEADDLQVYCPTERSAADFREEYAARYSSCADHTAQPDRFRLLSARALYYPTGVFSPWNMQEGLDSFFADSQKKGKRNVRATAEMVWALEAVPGVEHLMAYESRLNYFIPGKPWISICLYNVTQFSGAQIMNVLRTHPFAISGGIVTENPYFVDPDDYLAAHAPEFLPTARKAIL